MVKYKMEFQPMRTYGKEMLPPDRLQFMGIMVNALGQMIQMVEGVTKVDVNNEDFYLIIEGNDEIADTLHKFHEQAILTKLE